MPFAATWTGRTACALQVALRLTNEAFAEHLGIAVRTVASWHQKPDLRPKTEMQQLLDTALEQASAAARARFTGLTAAQAEPADATDPGTGNAAVSDPDAERRLSQDPHVVTALEWLDRHAGRPAGTSRREVAARLARLDLADLQDRASRRLGAGRRRVAEALGTYYGEGIGTYGRYCATGDLLGEITTSILTCPTWLDLDTALGTSQDRLVLANPADEHLALDGEAAGHAAQRLAETLEAHTRLVNLPLYRLLDIGVRPGEVAGRLGLTDFVHYSLTMDLLEGELLDALAAGSEPLPGSLPLRAKYLPDMRSVLEVTGRLCVGGALALCAIARPANPARAADYLLLIQQRSGRVVNTSGRLSVIPKGFHQPLTDLRGDAQVAVTLQREMEEELFGRDDVDGTIGDQRSADPLHPSRLSEPMRWLTGGAGRLRIECTGFGLNLVSGNYEFASLIVIEDEEFWDRYGGHIAANWEASALRQYSSLDAPLLTDLIRDDAWSNEGLFALLQGLRRLARTGGSRVELPAFDWHLR
jgi:hypothetical protein